MKFPKSRLNIITKHDFSRTHQWIAKTNIKPLFCHLSLAALRRSDSKTSSETYQKLASGVQPCETTPMIARPDVAGTDWSSIHHPPAQCLVGLPGVGNRWPNMTWMQRGDQAWILQTSLLSIATNWYMRTYMRGRSAVKKSESWCNAHHQGPTALRSRYCTSQ